MFAFAHPTPARSLTFAAIYLFVGITTLVLSIRNRGKNIYRNGPSESFVTQMILILMFFIWGTCSIGDACGWAYFQRHSAILHFGSMGIVAICFGVDFLRAHLPSALAHGDKRLLRPVIIALIAALILVWLWWLSLQDKNAAGVFTSGV